MRIRKLEIQGFKSFVDPTVVDFDLPIVGIVGPNGCGKSNVVDAIRWVMGEQSAKHLRGKSMEDVIFNGSSNRAPIGMATVALTFSTGDGIVPPEYSGFSEITVTRRLYRSGESEYYINKVPCRLRDILDLFLGTGAGSKAYSIIAQGQVDFAINAKPEDRRRLIEEAAGISKFKMRRDAALRRMEATQNNLLRLGDILNEIRRQVRSLERQVQRAERYKEYRDELRQIEFHLAAVDYAVKETERQQLSAQATQWQEEEALAQGALAELENRLETLRIQLAEEEAELSRGQNQLFELSNRLQLAQSQKLYNEQERSHLQQQQERWQQELVHIEAQLAQVREQGQQHQAQGGSLTELTAAAQAQFSQAHAAWETAEQTRRNQRASEMQLREQVARGAQRQASLQSQIAALEEQTPKLLARFQSYEGELQVQQALLQESQGQLQSVEQNVGNFLQQEHELSQRSEQFREKQETLEKNREQQQREVQQVQEELLQKRSRLRSLVDLEKSLAGYGSGVRSVLKQTELSGLRGLVADVLSTKPEYEAALIAALGERLQCVIAENHQSIRSALSFLQREGAARTSFIPQQLRLQSLGMLPQGPGVQGALLQFIDVKPQHQNLAQYLLGDVVLVDSLELALSLWQSGQSNRRFVTLAGELVDAAGVVTAGRAGEADLLAQRREIETLRREVVRLEQEAGFKEDSFSQLEGTLSELKLEHRALEQERQQLAIARARVEQDRAHLRQREQQAKQQTGSLEQRLNSLREEQSVQERQQQETRASLASLEADYNRLNDALSALQSEAEACEQATIQAQEQLTEAKLRLASVQERETSYRAELERFQKLEAELRQRGNTRTDELQSATERQSQLQAILEELIAQAEQLQQDVDQQKQAQATRQEQFQRRRTELQEEELKLRDLRKRWDHSRQQSGELKIQLVQVESDLARLTTQMSEKYAIVLADIVAEWRERVPECAEPRTRAEELREKIDKLGPVNLEALSEFDGLKEREQFLSTQYADLETSIENLKKVIRKINLTTKERFEETFKAVQEKFSQVFPRLFKGGRAEITLEDETDTLNSGVQLLVQPPGKRLSQVSLLSGGEKALSAVAFIFSIFLVKPSPFCILDEVDAPLDDVNTGRFLKLIEEMTERTQFILITHNKTSMELANALYGVTMQEPGVSKIVSVRLDEMKSQERQAQA